jgi:hypothetical protein
MKTCQRKGEEEFYPKPTGMTLPPSKTKINVGRCIGRGSSNNVYDVTGRANQVLRAIANMDREDPEPAEAMQQENALMRIAAEERIHPVIYAQSLMHAPFGCGGFVAATLMQKETPFKKFLLDAEFDVLDADQGKLARVFSSLYATICKVADLGLCLCDIKPENFLCVPRTGVCHLIDLGLDFVVWMDPAVVDLFETVDGADSRLGGACAKTRGVQLYLMLLLFYAHLTYFTNYASKPRARYFSERLRGILANSCIPLQALLGLSQHHDEHEDVCKRKRHSEEEKDLMQILFCRVKHYFKKNLQWFLVDFVQRNGLRSVQCNGKSLQQIVVGGQVYSKDFVSCTSSRQAVLRRIDERQYPCLNVASGVLPPRQYFIDEGKASVKIKSSKGSGKGFGKGFGKASDKESSNAPVEVPELQLQYEEDALPDCSKA